jgi:hypothetical protein
VSMRAKYGNDWKERRLDDDYLFTMATGGIDHGHIFGLGAVIDRRNLPSGSTTTSLRSTASHSTNPVRILLEEDVTRMMEERDRKREAEFQRQLEKAIQRSRNEMMHMFYAISTALCPSTGRLIK